MQKANRFKLIECPRDAMQGVKQFIPTELKVAYLNLLLQAGFDTLDFGSFVSPKMVPQMQDTATVLSQLDLSGATQLLAIVANVRGMEEAVGFEEISYLGFPFSISETFQQRNTQASIAESLNTVEQLLDLCRRNNKKPVIYLSMGFGNPYGDAWSSEIVAHWAKELVDRGAGILSLSDTVGMAKPEQIKNLYTLLANEFADTEIGLHLHSTPDIWEEKMEAAYAAGCRRMDGALKGFGGCPMAADELTGNMPTEKMIEYLSRKGENLGLNLDKWQEALVFSANVFH
ncbi:MAG: hydroxymethylglutaryl-CoA lyase [Sphingobacteriaceae bacterium]